MRRTISVLIIISVALFSAAAIAADESWGVLETASPDECFYGVGSGDNQYPLTGHCSGQLKTNEAYVWGLTKYANNLFFGTAANVHCLVAQGYFGQTEPILTEDYVCEFCEGPGIPLGDMRSPSMYMYNQAQGLVRLNDSIPDVASRALIDETLGIRSAGSHNGVAFLAGPTPPGSGGVNLFAFNAENGAFLAATTMTDYSNIRNWLVVENALYVGVGGAEGGAGSGAVLRWTGQYSSDPDLLFVFEVVGAGMDGIASELTEHQGRIYTSTWPILGSNNVAGIWMSPLIQDLSPGNSNWTKIWSASDYEPDYVTALAYYGGGIASFDGCLYWGTMHVPGLAAMLHIGTYYTEQNPPTEEEQNQIYERTSRATSIFRARNPGTPYQEIKVLYGGSGSLPFIRGYYMAYNLATGWQFVQNLMGQFPLYGSEGFDNPYNNYCWTMKTPKKQGWNGLYVGTCDYGYLIKDFDSGSVDLFPSGYEFGADLFRFDSSRSGAVPVSVDGMGNPMNYGIRTMISDENALYLGTANPMNLNRYGGWELIELTSTTTPGTPGKPVKPGTPVK